MKKISMLVSALLISGAVTFAHDGKDCCKKGDKKTTKKECSKEGKDCCSKKNTKTVIELKKSDKVETMNAVAPANAVPRRVQAAPAKS